MPRPRRVLISIDETPYYHCISRCVRRTFLCGKDRVTGKSYEHRRKWIQDRLLFLGQVFSIKVCAFAVMSNHTHVVLYVDKQACLAMTDSDVLHRWHQIYKGTRLTRLFVDKHLNKTLSDAELYTVRQTINIYRERLCSISWFMKLLNEPIARQANKEDQCTGHFWEGRFKSQALVDEKALVACMAYVDLNPVRAGMTNSIPSSRYTSARLRYFSAQKSKQPSTLQPFVGTTAANINIGIPFLLKDYLELLDYTSRLQHPSKKGYVKMDVPSIVKSLHLSTEQWRSLSMEIETSFRTKIDLHDWHLVA